MTFKEELEIVRGREIAFRTPIDKIPCNETSDRNRLCQKPLVSVLMVTFNHETSIARAIESALDQVTDFEYEIVIGEDCSRDKTRDICFEFQKRFPEKIRILWSDENVFKMCGNGPRVCSKCRGEFIAILEGDDCWINRHKLQKQVEVLQQNPSVGICIGGGVLHYVQGGEEFPYDGFLFKPGKMRGRDFLNQVLFEGWRVKRGLTVLTPSVMLRKSALESARKKYDIFTWNLITLDTLCWAGVASVSDAYYLQDEVAQYNITPGSASFNPALDLDGDSSVVKVYFARMTAGRTWARLPYCFLYRFICGIVRKCSALPPQLQRTMYRDLMSNVEMRRLRFKFPLSLTFLSLRTGVLTGLWARVLMRLNGYSVRMWQMWRNR